MYKKLFCLIPVMMLISMVSSVQAEPFSILPTQDAYVANDSQQGPDLSVSGDDGIHIRNTADPRRRVGYMAFDISGLKAEGGYFANVSLSIDGHDAGDVDLYGVIEELDSINVDTLTWNTAPGVQNDPTPARDSPVELDLEDLVGPLMTFQVVRRARESTETSQALADFLNSDDDGIIVFLLASAEEGDSGIIYSIENNPDSGSGTLLEGDVLKIVGFASNPKPADRLGNVVRDVVLSWTPGEFADKHDVYFGTNFDDVNNADTSSPLLISPAQDANSFNAGRLEFEQTYFWRIDEVNAPPDTKVFKGNVWGFTVEAFAIPIPSESITATADSNAPGQGPEQTINNSGLDANDLHSIVTSAMWLTAEGETGPAWIQYEFDKPFRLLEMSVWNYNGEYILTLFGLMDVTVEYSTNGTNWTQIGSVAEFAVATGTDDYAANTIVPFGGVAAQYVRITSTNNWSEGGFAQSGLSEVRFMQEPVHARIPNPADEATNVAVDVTLRWRAGREAAEHKVYFSADQQAVIDSTALVDTVSQAGYGPLSLDMGSTYSWRVDEVNSAEATSIWPGDTWNFTTSDYIVVDDFESYNDIEEGEESNLVYVTWSDGGYGATNDPTNGSTIGYLTVPSLDPNIVHGGNQSVPVFYDNTSAGLSEVKVNTADLPIGSDWSQGSSQTLVLWFYGDPGNNSDADRMYVKIDNIKVDYDGDISRPLWTQWNIDLLALGVNLSNVTQFTIGFERTGTIGGSGMVFIDDISLYRVAPPLPLELVWVEAETGTVSAPMEIFDDPNASGGQYISTEDGTADEGTAPPYPEGTATIPFTVAGGTYTARFRVGFPGGDDSCWVRIQGATVQSDVTPLADGWLHFNDIPTGDFWHWSQEVKHEGGAEPPVEFTLAAGTYNLEIAYRGADLRIDAIVFSKIE